MKERNYFKKLATFLISIILSIIMLPFQVSATANDIQLHWAGDIIEEWLDKGMARGYPDGSFRPDNNITRAEFMVLVNNAFGFYEEASIDIIDVFQEDWHYSIIRQAMAVGYISGYPDGTMRANKSITREEAAVIIARIKKLEKNSNATLSTVDLFDTAEWSLDYIGAVISAGYMKGYPSGDFKAKSPLKRCEAIAALNEAIKTITVVYDMAGTFGPAEGLEVIEGNVAVKADGVVLQNLHIKGELKISEEVGDGNVVLNNIMVDGNTYIHGGGKDSIHIYGGNFNKIIIRKTSTDQVRIVAIDAEGIEVVISEDAIGESIILNGSFENVTIEADNVDIQLQEGARVEEMNVAPEAKGTIISLDNLSVINYLLVEGDLETRGNGSIAKADIKANSVIFNQAPKDIIIADSVTIPPKTLTQITPPITQTSRDTDVGKSQVVARGISVSPTAMTLLVGGPARKIEAAIIPSNATNKGIVWSSSNTSIATVVNGMVTPISSGTAIITVSSAENPAINAAISVQVLRLVSMKPFIPGEGGTIPYNDMPGEASDLGLLLYSGSERYEEENITCLYYYEGNMLINDLSLQYKGSSGDWQDAFDFVDDIYDEDNYYSIYLTVDEPYQYRMVDWDGKTSNIAEAYFFEDEEYYGQIYPDYDIWRPIAGEEINVECNFYHSDNSYTYSYKWFRVNPKTFEIIPIEGAANHDYVRTEEDVGYYLLVNAYLEDENPILISQAIIGPTIIPNKAYVTNVSDNGFTINLYKSVEGLTSEDFELYSGYIKVDITSVTPGENNAIYYIEADLSDNEGPFYLLNNSTVWQLATDLGDSIYYEIGFTKGQVIDISQFVNGGIVECTEIEGITVDSTPGSEKLYMISGTSLDHIFNITISNFDGRSLESYYVYYDFDSWTIEFYEAKVDLSQYIADGAAVALLIEYYMDLDNDDKTVNIDCFDENMELYFDVIGGVNDGKRFRLFYEDYFMVEELTSIITSIEIIGPSSLELKRYGTDPDITYTAVVRDQNNEVMEDEKVTWEIKEPAWPMTIDVDSGVLRIPYNMIYPPESITLVATSKIDTSIKEEFTIDLTLEARKEKIIKATLIGKILNGNIDAVPLGTTVSNLKAALEVSEGASVEILQESKGSVVENQVETKVTSSMVIEVTAENGTKAEYSITMATYSINLTGGSNEDVIGTTIPLSGGLGIVHWYPWNSPARFVKITRTGTGDITNITVLSSEPDKFGISTNLTDKSPSLLTDTLTSSISETHFYVYAKEGLEPGEHTAIFTVTAYNGVSEEFYVYIKVVFDSSH